MKNAKMENKDMDKDLDRAEAFDDSTSSEEDLTFVEKMIESNTLGEVEKKLLLGVIQAPPQDKKRYDKETPEQARERRRKRRKEKGLSDDSSEYDSEEPGSDDYVGALAAGTRNNNSLSELTSIQPAEGSVVNLFGSKNVFSSVKGKMNNKILSEKEISEMNLEKELLRCPIGFDPVKWSVMTRKEKMRHLGISDKEWNSLVRE